MLKIDLRAAPSPTDRQVWVTGGVQSRGASALSPPMSFHSIWNYEFSENWVGPDARYESAPEALCLHSILQVTKNFHTLTSCAAYDHKHEVNKARKIVYVQQRRQQKFREVTELIITSLPGGRAHGSHQTSAAFHLPEAYQH